MTHPDDPDFDSFVRRAKAASVKGLLEQRGLWKALMNGDRGVACPACGGKDRFAVNVRKNVFTCRRSGAGGGALALWAHLQGMERIRGKDFIEACSEILNEDPPRPDPSETAAMKMARLDRRNQLMEMQAQQAVKDQAVAAQAARAFREKARWRGYAFWREAAPALGTPVEDMLRIRGLSVPPEADLRFHADMPLWSAPPPHGKIVHRGAAMLGAICGPEWVPTALGLRRRFLGVHITWIDLKDRDGKLRMPDPETGELLPAKKVVGSWKGGTVYLDGPRGERMIYEDDGRAPEIEVAGEGIETTLSARQFLLADPDWMGRDVTSFRSWITLDNFAGLSDGTIPHPSIKQEDKSGRFRAQRIRGPLPKWPDEWEPVPISRQTGELIWLQDGDSEAFFTQMACQRGAERYGRHYDWLTIRLAAANAGEDFNTMWRGMAA